MPRQLRRAIDFLTEHAEDVAGLVISSKKLEIITFDEKVLHLSALGRARAGGTWKSASLAGAKVVALRAKRFRVKMTFLKRLRQAGAKWRASSRLPPSLL